MNPAFLPFNAAIAAARSARTSEERDAVLRDVSARMKAANSANACDSAAQIIDAFLENENRYGD